MTAPLARFQLPSASLVATDPITGNHWSIPFQYAPESLRRSIEPNLVGGQPGARASAVRFAGSASETWTMDCRLVADDAANSPISAGSGQSVAPQLAALTVLASPSWTQVADEQALLAAGIIEVMPALADWLMLVLGPARVIPCQLIAISIVEEIYDVNLEPVLATVSLTLRIITTSDVGSDNPSWSAAAAYQISQEALANSAWLAGTGTSP